MSQAFLGEIRMFVGTFAPKDWALCDGQLIPISRNTALFSLLGTSYGGDGRVTFALPNLQERVPLHWGQGSGLSNRGLGETGGAAQVGITVDQMGPHNHTPASSRGVGQEKSPAGAVWSAIGGTRDTQYKVPSSTSAPDAKMDVRAIGANAGNGIPHENRAPFLVVNYIICLNGIFPPRG